MSGFGYVLVLFMLVVAACGPMTGYEGHGGGWGMGPGMMGGYGFMGIIFWIVIIVGVVFLVKYVIQSGGKGGGKGASGNSALEILEQRYARGEIDQQEFEEKKRKLTR